MNKARSGSWKSWDSNPGPPASKVQTLPPKIPLSGGGCCCLCLLLGLQETTSPWGQQPCLTQPPSCQPVCKARQGDFGFAGGPHVTEANWMQ